MKTFVLKDYDSGGKVCAIIKSPLNAAKVQNIITEMKMQHPDYDDIILTELLMEAGCSITWFNDIEDVWW